jgi:phage-related protein
MLQAIETKIKAIADATGLKIETVIKYIENCVHNVFHTVNLDANGMKDHIEQVASKNEEEIKAGVDKAIADAAADAQAGLAGAATDVSKVAADASNTLGQAAATAEGAVKSV